LLQHYRNILLYYPACPTNDYPTDSRISIKGIRDDWLVSDGQGSVVLKGSIRCWIANWPPGNDSRAVENRSYRRKAQDIKVG
jgi:hypothetical protein